MTSPSHGKKWDNAAVSIKYSKSRLMENKHNQRLQAMIHWNKWKNIFLLNVALSGLSWSNPWTAEGCLIKSWQPESRSGEDANLLLPNNQSVRRRSRGNCLFCAYCRVILINSCGLKGGISALVSQVADGTESVSTNIFYLIWQYSYWWFRNYILPAFSPFSPTVSLSPFHRQVLLVWFLQTKRIIYVYKVLSNSTNVHAESSSAHYERWPQQYISPPRIADPVRRSIFKQ
jgi:hypothetical protein